MHISFCIHVYIRRLLQNGFSKTNRNYSFYRLCFYPLKTFLVIVNYFCLEKINIFAPTLYMFIKVSGMLWLTEMIPLYLVGHVLPLVQLQNLFALVFYKLFFCKNPLFFYVCSSINQDWVELPEWNLLYLLGVVHRSVLL